MMNGRPSPPPVPPQPADAEVPRRALSRLALSEAAREAAERAQTLVPTVAEDPAELVELAAGLTALAEEVLVRAAVHARECGVSWAGIGDRLDGGITRQSAQARFGEHVDEFAEALDRPWARSGTFLSSQLPPGCADPAATAERLDAWCAEHADETTKLLADRAGTADRMVSAGLPVHTATSRAGAVLRRTRWISERRAAGEAVADDVLADHEQRKAAALDEAAATDDRAPAAIAARLRSTETEQEGQQLLAGLDLDRAGLLAVASALHLTRLHSASKAEIRRRILKQAIGARRKYAGLRSGWQDEPTPPAAHPDRPAGT